LEIFDFGKSYAKIGSAERLSRASEADALSVRQSVLVSVCSAYYNCLAAAALKEVGIEALKLSETHLDQAKILLEAGKGVQYNVVTAEVDVENNRLSLVKADNNVNLCRLTLANALGAKLADTLFFTDSLAESVSLTSLESILKIAYENRPEIKSAQLKREAAQKNVTAASCSRYPDITSSAGAGYQSPISRIDWQQNWNIGVNLLLPLYEGGAISASIRQAKGNLITAEGNLAVTEQNVTLDVEQQFQSVNAAFSSIEAAKKLVEQTSSALSIAQERFKIGSGSPLEISNAELVFSNAKIALIQAKTDLNSANANLRRAMGTLTEAFVR
jgi:outer membrane protein TolC